jgi:hypothetical protein
VKTTLAPWRPLGAANVTAAGRLVLPTPPRTPGIYRFLLYGPSSSVYVGETEDLARRFYQYGNPGPSQRTNLRMRGRMADAIGAGGSVQIEVCDSATVSVGSCSEQLDLRVKAHRLLAEDEALAEARSAGLGAVENVGG